MDNQMPKTKKGMISRRGFLKLSAAAAAAAVSTDPSRVLHALVTADTGTVKPMDDYRREAAKEIDAADAEGELERISREIDADAP